MNFLASRDAEDRQFDVSDFPLRQKARYLYP